MADASMPSVVSSGNHLACNDTTSYKQRYRTLKRKLKFLLYEQESFQEELRRSQRKLLRVSKDKSFLLDQLLQVEGLDCNSSDDDETVASSSDDELQKKIAADSAPKEKRTKKQTTPGSNSPADVGQPQSTSSQETFLKWYCHENCPVDRYMKTADHSNQVRCKYVENDKQCVKYISKRSKSGYCAAHRTVIRISKQASSVKPTQLTPRATASHEADMLSQAQLSDLNLLTNQESKELPQASAELPQDVFSMDDDEPTSENEGSTESHSYHSNIYEGDDDLVIDIPE